VKFKEMDKDQKDAYKNILLHMIQIKSQEEQEFGRQFLRLLTLGNGSGILLLSTFMGAISSNSENISALVDPLIKFSVGAILAALMYFPFLAVSHQATASIVNQVDQFLRNQISIDDIRGYGLSKKGRVVVFVLQVSSLIAFVWGLYECVIILKSWG